METPPAKPESNDAGSAEERDVNTPAAQKHPRVSLRETMIRKLVAGGCPDDMKSITKVINGVMERAIASGQAYRCDFADLTNIELELANRTSELSILSLRLGELMADIGGAAEHRAVLYFNREAVAQARKALKEVTK